MDGIIQAINYAPNKNGYSMLRPNQRTVIEHYMKGKDVIYCSTSGRSKSLIFEMSPFLFQYH